MVGQLALAQVGERGDEDTMKSLWREVLGHGCVGLGVTLLGASLYFAGEPQLNLGRAQTNAIAGVAAVSGGVLTFGAGRRLLSQREDESAESEPERTRHGGA